MRIVVTGLSGNLGTALLRRLGAPGSGHDVVGVVRRPPEGGEPYQLAEWVGLDLADDLAGPRLREVFEGADAVVHLAWAFQPSRDLDLLDRATVGATREVLAAADSARVPHLLHLSSLGVYSPAPPGDPTVRITEDYPRRGVESLSYSRQKVAAEDLLDAYEASRPARRRMTVTRVRPGIVLQRAAASGMLRYGAPAWLPTRLVPLLPVLPLDRALTFPAVHADDVAAALVTALERRAGGAFNLATEPPVTRDLLAQALGAVGVHVPMPLVRGAAALAYRAHLQPLDPGWLDLAAAVPLMDTTRARTELDWEPAYDALEALEDFVRGIGEHAGTSSAPLRPRAAFAEVRRAVLRGPVSLRSRP